MIKLKIVSIFAIFWISLLLVPVMAKERERSIWQDRRLWPNAEAVERSDSSAMSFSHQADTLSGQLPVFSRKHDKRLVQMCRSEPMKVPTSKQKSYSSLVRPTIPLQTQVLPLSKFEGPYMSPERLSREDLVNTLEVSIYQSAAERVVVEFCALTRKSDVEHNLRMKPIVIATAMTMIAYITFHGSKCATLAEVTASAIGAIEYHKNVCRAVRLKSFRANK